MTDFLQQLGADLDEAAGRRASRRSRSRLVRGTVAACAVVAAVACLMLLADSMPTGQDRRTAGEREAANGQPITMPAPAQLASCEIGARPDYFIPGDSSAAILGCVRLPVSGQRVEFSAKRARLDGAEHLCINPAYGSGQFIPAICKLEPPAPQFAVRDARQPREGAEGYGYVIWGTAGDAQSVLASFEGGTADAVVIAVPAEIARDYDEISFKLFVVELPLAAACGQVTIEADEASAAIEPQPTTCQAVERRSNDSQP